MLPVNLALVSEVPDHDSGDVSRVAAALQRQATRDFGPLWNVQATVDAFPRLEDVPVGYWPMIVANDIERPEAAGVHEDENGQPFALVEMSDSWSLTASHEMLEMLCDPFGKRIIPGESPKRGQGRVEFLVEVCDPCEASKFAYRVNDILVSDFYTPRYFDPVASEGTRYSFTGALTGPRQVLPGGYLSWHDPVSDHWWQQVFFDSTSKFRDLNVRDSNATSLRAWIDGQTDHPGIDRGLKKSDKALRAAVVAGRQTEKSASLKAAAWRKQVKALKRAKK
ncbi:MAG TPA: hypothetical protein VK471_06285 [Solirubrobacterales bacterium]|nr:hypothetical protein [Solirubrobacterales bacterium]